MRTIQPRPGRAFSAIGLLASIVIMSMLAVVYLKYQTKLFGGNPPTGSDAASLESWLEQDLGTSGTVSLTDLGPTRIAGQNSSGEFAYDFSDNFPYAQVDRSGKDGIFTLLDNIASMEIVAFHPSRLPVDDAVPDELLGKIERLQMKIQYHSGKEDPTYYLRSKTHGVDLDGDPTNGVARIETALINVAIKK